MGRNNEAQKPLLIALVIIIAVVYLVNEQYGTAIVQWWENYGVALILTIILAVGLIISWRVGLFEILLEYVDKRKLKKREDKWRREGKEFVFDYPSIELGSVRRPSFYLQTLASSLVALTSAPC